MLFSSLNEAEPCHGGNRQVREMPLLARPVNEREAALIPQVNIQENDVRQGFRGNSNETLFQSLRKDCFMALGFKPVS